MVKPPSMLSDVNHCHLSLLFSSYPNPSRISYIELSLHDHMRKCKINSCCWLDQQSICTKLLIDQRRCLSMQKTSRDIKKSQRQSQRQYLKTVLCSQKACTRCYQSFPSICDRDHWVFPELASHLSGCVCRCVGHPFLCLVRCRLWSYRGRGTSRFYQGSELPQQC